MKTAGAVLALLFLPLAAAGMATYPSEGVAIPSTGIAGPSPGIAIPSTGCMANAPDGAGKSMGPDAGPPRFSALPRASAPSGGSAQPPVFPPVQPGVSPHHEDSTSAPATDPNPRPARSSTESPPCGYIPPLLDLEFPTKPRCPGLPGEIDARLCIPLPPDNGTLAFEGTVRWYWKESEDLIYPPDPDEPIVITFGGTQANPSWLTFKVEPESFTITAADLFDPRNTRNETQGGTMVVYYWFERPVTVTFTRTGGPGAAEAERFADREGVQPVYVKAKSTGSGAYYKESFGGEEFRFNATALLPKADPEQAALPPAAWAVVTILAAATIRRRRA